MRNASIFAVGVILWAFSATQANVFWSNPSGSADYFDWQNGQSLYGLFGDPILAGGTLVFSPSNFRAESIDGLQGSVSDRLEFELIAHSGFSFKNIAISEFGDYGILGDGSVNVTSTVSIKNLDTAETLNGAFVASPSMPTSEGEDIWQAIAQVNFIPADWTHIKITLENELFANSQPGSATYIEKKVLDSSITMQNIPEPATVVMLSIGAAFMFRDFLKRKSAI